MKTKNEKAKIENDTPQIPIINYSDSEKKITRFLQLQYLDYAEIYDHFEHSEYTGACFEGERIGELRIVNESDGLYPQSNYGCSDAEDRHDFIYYILSTETEALIRANSFGEPVYGLSEIKHNFFIKNRKIQGFKVDADEECVRVKVFTDSFPLELGIEIDKPEFMEFVISISDAKLDFDKSIESFRKKIRAVIMGEFGPVLGLNTRYYLSRIIDEVIERVLELTGEQE